ncbi:MAG: AbrB/MazE/SpoVT family DNA-binding domain-containing protein [Promethearchaeati archaeon]
MTNIKNKYKRSIIKLGNSKAITFPQEWTKEADLQEKSEITLYPVDKKTLVVRVQEKSEEKIVYRINSDQMPIKLVRQAIISAFKLNVDYIYLKYKTSNKEKLYELLIELRREIIGIDFKDVPNTNEFYINFLLDASKTTFHEVLVDLVNVFETIIRNIVKSEQDKISDLLLDEIDRKYSLGTRILVTGLAEYPVSRNKFPIIRFLGDRVVLLYVRDFINEALINLQGIPDQIISNYSDLLLKVPDLLNALIENYNNINLESISEFQNYMIELQDQLENTEFGTDQTKCHIKNVIQYYLNSFKNFFDIAITRMIESDIGMS